MIPKRHVMLYLSNLRHAAIDIPLALTGPFPWRDLLDAIAEVAIALAAILFIVAAIITFPVSVPALALYNTRVDIAERRWRNEQLNRQADAEESTN
jgi:hypothetical protein